jgi:hypothetical protein
MTDADEVAGRAGTETGERGASHRRWWVVVLAAVVVLVAGGYVWAATRPAPYVGRTESARLVGDSCTNVLELYGPMPKGPLHAVDGKSWLNRTTDSPEQLLERADRIEPARPSSWSHFTQDLSGRVHFSSGSAATFTTDGGYVIPLVHRTRPELSPGPHSCAIFGPN